MASHKKTPTKHIPIANSFVSTEWCNYNKTQPKNAIFLILQESKIKYIQGYLHNKYKNSIKKQ